MSDGYNPSPTFSGANFGRRNSTECQRVRRMRHESKQRPLLQAEYGLGFETEVSKNDTVQQQTPATNKPSRIAMPRFGRRHAKTIRTDMDSLDKAIRQEDKFLARRDSPRGKKSVHSAETVFHGSPTTNEQLPNTQRIDMARHDGDDDENEGFVLSDPEDDSGDQYLAYQGKIPSHVGLLLQVETPRSLRSMKFKTKLAPVQECSEE